MGFGSVHISLLEAFSNLKSSDHTILFSSRIPRVFLSIIAGVGCAISGLAIQTIFKNPLAGPTTLGINSGASLGVSLFFLIPGFASVFEGFGSGIFAVIGAVGFLIVLLFTTSKTVNLSLVLIVGLLLSYASYAVIEVLVQLSNDDGLRGYVFWGMGSLNRGGWEEIGILSFVSILVIFVLRKKANWLNSYLLGEKELFLLDGQNSKKTKRLIIVLIGLWVGVITAVVGPIAFVGVIVPNLLKIFLKTSDIKKLLIPTALLGAILVLLSDFLSRGVLFPFILPLNSVLSILGVPVIIYLLLKKLSFARSK